jgi:hypothetical protein
MYWPKRVTYAFESAEVRGYMAAIDHNHHCQRTIATKADGTPRLHRKYQPRSARWSVAYARIPKNYSYLPTLIDMCIEVAAGNVKVSGRAERPSYNPMEIAPTLAGVPPESSVLASSHFSRFTELYD